MSLYSINNIRMMEVIDVNTGIKLGFVRDLSIDTVDYKVLSLIIPKEKNSFFSKNSNIEIPWSKVVKIGVDVILVNLDEPILEDE